MALLELKEISKIYGFGDATTIALDEVDLSVDKGEFVAVMGPSGSGKSSLMNMIGLLDRPTHGTYQLGGRSVARLRPNQRAKVRRDRVGFVFQSFNLLPKITALENVALPLMYKGVGTTRRLKHASAILGQVGLADKEYFFPKQLSGGQMQRVAIARALVNNPDIIIAGEPTGNLDSESSRLVMELLGEIHALGHTILLVTHNPELTRYVTRVVYMHDGQIVYDEQTAIGEVPKLARRASLLLQRRTAEDDYAGVSALMGIDNEKPKKTKRTKRRTARRKPVRAHKQARKIKR
ncbi:MAG: ABC transporter ATP-binding protein [Candidatus Saccharibacteria bacterium]|nr:ABC transporter ATP-binding protein [Candidatus Saccharibacteria bacterium]